MITLNKIKTSKLFNLLFPDIIIWTVIILLFVFAVNWSSDFAQRHEQIRDVLINCIPYIAAVYANFAVFKFCLLPKK